MSSITRRETSRGAALGPDGRLLFLTRAARMFSYGFLSVVLVLDLADLGFSEGRIGLLLTLTLVGDTLTSLWITLHADRMGRKRMLVLGAGLMVAAGVPFALSGDFTVLVLAATFGVIQSLVAYWFHQKFGVAPDERSAAASLTGIARTTGAAISPVLAGPMLAVPDLAGLPLIAGGLKLLYDVLLYRSFKSSEAGGTGPKG